MALRIGANRRKVSTNKDGRLSATCRNRVSRVSRNSQKTMYPMQAPIAVPAPLQTRSRTEGVLGRPCLRSRRNQSHPYIWNRTGRRKEYKAGFRPVHCGRLILGLTTKGAKDPKGWDILLNFVLIVTSLEKLGSEGSWWREMPPFSSILCGRAQVHDTLRGKSILLCELCVSAVKTLWRSHGGGAERIK